MRLILFFGVVLKIIIPIAGVLHFKTETNCSFVSENLYIPEIMPIKYDVKIFIRPRLRILSGYVDILVNVTKPTTNISLHAGPTYGYDLTDELHSTPYNLSDFHYCEEKEVLVLKFDKILDEGTYRLVIAYRSVLNKNSDKMFYPITWTSRRNQNLMLTNFYTPNAIRALFPCWDDPRVKATYDISIQTPADYTVLSTMHDKLSFFAVPSITQFGIKLTQYEEFVPTPTHLITFLIARDIIRDYKQRDMHYMWYKTDADKKFTYIIGMAEVATSFFFRSMQISTLYFSAKVNHVVLPKSPMKSVGMPGLVVYREKDVTLDEVLDFPGRTLDVLTLVTYEMARQLFVKVVPSQSSVDYIWLNEMFASFYGYFILDKIWSSAKGLISLFAVKVIQPSLNTDMLLEREPIIHKTKNNDGIDGLLYPLLYHKKAYALIRMLFILYNPDIFKEAIRKYVHEHTKDVWTILEEVQPLKVESDYTVKDIMNTWLTARHHPELFVERDYEKRSASCLPWRISSKRNPEWIIPINYITESNYDSYNISKVLWLKWGQVKSINDINSEDFLIVNIEQTGFYRVNYDTRNWLLISTYLQNHNFSHIPAINRAQLINDAYYFTTKNQLESYIFVNVTRHLKWDTDFVAWYPMFNILSDMSSYFKFPESKSINRHFSEILRNVLIKIGCRENPSDHNREKSFRDLVQRWTCKLGHSICRNDSLMVYINNKDEVNRFPEMSKELLLYMGLKIDNLNEWGQILNKSVNYKNMVLRDILSCTENSTNIVHYLTLMLRTDYISKINESMGPICRNIVKKYVNQKAVLRFVIDNYDTILNRFPDHFPSGTLLSDMIMNVYSLENLDMIRKLADRLFALTIGDISFSPNFKESIDVLISHRKKYLTKVLDKFKMFHNWTDDV